MLGGSTVSGLGLVSGILVVSPKSCPRKEQPVNWQLGHRCPELMGNEGNPVSSKRINAGYNRQEKDLSTLQLPVFGAA